MSSPSRTEALDPSVQSQLGQEMINEMTKTFNSKMTSLATVIDKSLRRRDNIYFRKIDEYVKAIKKMQETNSSLMKLRIDKVFRLSSSLISSKNLQVIL